MHIDLPQADTPKVTFDDLMARGMAAHTAGDPVKALTAFESAMALHPQNTQAVSACAALLFELSRPRAAFALLQSIESLLLPDADGCANLGVAALSCGQEKAATSYFEHALMQNPGHSAALTHLGMLAAREQRWIDAIGLAGQSVACSPSDETAHTNLLDYLMGARRAAEAINHWQVLPEHLKDNPQVAIRRIVALGLSAEFDAANLAISQLSPQASQQLALFLQQGGATDLQNLFERQAHDAMHKCDWRDYPRLCAVVGEENLHQGFHSSLNTGLTSKAKAPPPFTVNRRAHEPAGCLNIGIAAISLRDKTATEALAAELSHYDTTRFKFHVYSPTPQPQAALSALLAAHNVVEIAHFTDEEAVWRIRLDRLDIWLDMTLFTRWHRPGIAQHRVAPVQVRALPSTRQQQFPAVTYDYALSDPVMEGSNNFIQPGTALALLPQSCWSAPEAVNTVGIKLSRQSAGLPPDSFVYCGFGPCVKITPTTFASWMHLLRLVPHAVLWLSPCSANAQANLGREAVLAGIQPERIIFAAADDSALSVLPSADLYLDMPGLCDAPSLMQALHAGVPAITAKGNSPASRMGGSILGSAGLTDCVFDNHEAVFAQALYLAQNPVALESLRRRMRLTVPQSALFDVTRRTKEKAMVWTMMVERSRAGLPPATVNTADFKLS